MDSNNDQFTKQGQFILDQHHCPLCGSKLEIKASVDWEYGEVQEEAHCPSCQVRTRTVVHSLN